MDEVVDLARILIEDVIAANEGSATLLNVLVRFMVLSPCTDECHILRQIQTLQVTTPVKACQVLKGTELALL